MEEISVTNENIDDVANKIINRIFNLDIGQRRDIEKLGYQESIDFMSDVFTFCGEGSLYGNFLDKIITFIPESTANQYGADKVCIVASYLNHNYIDNDERWFDRNSKGLKLIKPYDTKIDLLKMLSTNDSSDNCLFIARSDTALLFENKVINFCNAKDTILEEELN